jgi:hypothetical protein
LNRSKLSALVLVPAALGLVLVSAPSAHAAALVDRLPAGASFIGSVDLDAVRKSALMGGQIPDSPLPDQVQPFERFLKRAGVDPRRDLSELAVAVMPGNGGDGDFAVLTRGTFDPKKVRAAAIQEGGKPATLGSISAVRMDQVAPPPAPAGASGPAPKKGPPMYLSFVDGLALFATEAATKQVQASGAQPGARSARPSEVPAGASIWLAGDVSSLDASAKAAMPGTGGMKRLVAWGLLDDGIELHALADTSDAAGAMQLAGLAQMAAGFAASSNEPGAAVLKGLSVSAQEKRVVASLKVSRADLLALEAAPPATK